MGNYCTCPGVSDKNGNIDINIKCCDMAMNQKNNTICKNHDNRTIANNNNINANNNNDINNISNNLNNNSIYSNSDNNIQKDKDFNCNNCQSFSLMQMHSFNEDKSITPSNNPLDGLVKLIPKNEQ